MLDWKRKNATWPDMICLVVTMVVSSDIIIVHASLVLLKNGMKNLKMILSCVSVLLKGNIKELWLINITTRLFKIFLGPWKDSFSNNRDSFFWSQSNLIHSDHKWAPKTRYLFFSNWKVPMPFWRRLRTLYSMTLVQY